MRLQDELHSRKGACRNKQRIPDHPQGLKAPSLTGPRTNVCAGGRLAHHLAYWGVYAGSYLRRGWVPHDEGAFAQSADRYCMENCHIAITRNLYGGLAYLNAFAFRYFGENFGTLRIVLFVFFLLWLPVFYWIASRLVSDWHAGV